MSPSTVAEFSKVTKEYRIGFLRQGRLCAVDAVDLSIEAGQIFGLLGPNRAGKTTLIKMLLSLCQPTSGRINRLGSSTRVQTTLSRVGYVHENQAFPRYLSARDLLEFYGALSLLSQTQVKNKVPELLELIGLADRADEPIGNFSKGMKQRLGLAQALINDPELLVLDEPSEGLDLAGREVVDAVIERKRSEGRTVILISHSLVDVERLCDRIGVIVKGQLVYTGTMNEATRNGTQSLEDAMREIYEHGN